MVKTAIRKVVSIITIIGFICTTMPAYGELAIGRHLRPFLIFSQQDSEEVDKTVGPPHAEYSPPEIRRQSSKVYVGTPNETTVRDAMHGPAILTLEPEEVRVTEVLKRYPEDPLLEVVRNYVEGFMENSDSERHKLIAYHNGPHCNELLELSDAVWPYLISLLNNPERAARHIRISGYSHDIGYFYSDDELLAKGHEERSKAIFREFFERYKDEFGLIDLELQAIMYIIGKTQLKMGEEFALEVRKDNMAYRLLKGLNEGKVLSNSDRKFLENYLNDNGFRLTKSLDDQGEDGHIERGIIMDAIICGKVIAVADVYGQSKTYPYRVAFLHPEFVYDDVILGRDPPLAKPTRLEQIAATPGFYYFVTENRLKFIMEPKFSKDLALGPKLPKELKEAHDANIKKMEDIGERINELINEGINIGDNKNELKRFVDDGKRLGIYTDSDVEILYDEIESLINEGLFQLERKLGTYKPIEVQTGI